MLSLLSFASCVIEPTEVQGKDLSVPTGLRIENGFLAWNAEQNHVDIRNNLEVIGGADFGIMSDEDVARNYLEWEKSLDNHSRATNMRKTNNGTSAAKSDWNYFENDPNSGESKHWFRYNEGNVGWNEN